LSEYWLSADDLYIRFFGFDVAGYLVLDLA